MDGDCYQSTLTEMAIKIPNRKSPQQIETIFLTIFLRVSKKEDSLLLLCIPSVKKMGIHN